MLDWQEYPGGSGAMAAAVKDGSLDAALMLTEAVVAADLKIWGAYTASPLVWGVHVKHGGTRTPEIYGISRYGSGSHLMALVSAKTTKFVVVESLEGARKALANGDAEAFMWEKFMTKPLVDSGEWDRINEVPTPWPCFSVAVKEDVDVDLVTSALADVRKEAESLVADPSKAVTDIAAEYNLPPEDVSEWIKSVKWCIKPQMPAATINLVTSTLLDAGISTQQKNYVLPGVTDTSTDLDAIGI